jgi:sulfur carrier protein
VQNRSDAPDGSPITQIYLNGEATDLDAGATIADVVGRFAPTTGVAVARNGEVVPRSTWDETPVEASDRLEVLTVAPGG